jgi:hypothetical protein
VKDAYQEDEITYYGEHSSDGLRHGRVVMLTKTEVILARFKHGKRHGHQIYCNDEGKRCAK